VIKSRFLPAAEVELLKEVAYYSNVSDGLGIKFAHAVESAVKNAVSNPSSGAPSPKGTRSRPVKGFPFSVVYRASDTEILVVALMHHRRVPGYWANRIA
jgi:plasmid stabilization system protein ParE